jgi:hypothetical protein
MQPNKKVKNGAILANCCNQAWLLKNSIFSKTAEIWGIENV